MDCRTARLLLDCACPHATELEASEAAALEGHLSGCPECDALARGDRQADEQLGQAMRGVPVPEGLRQRLLDRLATDRRRWWRRQLFRGGVAAAAAALLLALGVWHFAAAFRMPQLNPDQIAASLAHKADVPFTPEKVEAWFKEKHPDLVMIAPRDVNQQLLRYDLLADYGMSDLEGKQVPMLFFVDGSNNRVWIYLVSERQYDLQAARDQLSSTSGGSPLHVELRPCQEDNRLAYVIVYLGDLNVFLSKELRPAF